MICNGREILHVRRCNLVESQRPYIEHLPSSDVVFHIAYVRLRLSTVPIFILKNSAKCDVCGFEHDAPVTLSSQ